MEKLLEVKDMYFSYGKVEVTLIENLRR